MNYKKEQTRINKNIKALTSLRDLVTELQTQLNQNFTIENINRELRKQQKEYENILTKIINDDPKVIPAIIVK